MLLSSLKNFKRNFVLKIRFPFFKKGPEKELQTYLKKNFHLSPGDISLYKTALQHKSLFREQKEVTVYNERLEFLGDAVLDTIVADYLYSFYPDEQEGSLTKLKAKIVNREYLNKLGEKFKIQEQLKFQVYGDNTPKSIIGNAFEAMIGAIYLDKGFNYTRKFVITHVIKKYIDPHELMYEEFDYKSKIIIWSQREKNKLQFELTKEERIGIERIYHIVLLVDGVKICAEKARNKKEAEQLAAKTACSILNIN